MWKIMHQGFKPCLENKFNFVEALLSKYWLALNILSYQSSIKYKKKKLHGRRKIKSLLDKDGKNNFTYYHLKYFLLYF